MHILNGRDLRFIGDIDTALGRSSGCFFGHAVAYNLPMISLTKRRVLHLWIALLAVLFAALAPTISRALAANLQYDIVEVCTAGGYKAVKISKDGSAPSPKSRMDHCAYCANHAGSHALPGMPPVSIPRLAGRDFYPSLFYLAPRPLHAWSAANPRAPPLPA